MSPNLTRRLTNRSTPFLLLLAVFAASPSQAQSPAVTEVKRQAQATYSDIKATLGVVPEYMRAFPEEAITGAWQEMKKVQLSRDTALSPKHKELIGLAVASQIPCRYCVLFHTTAARFHGASDQEIKEAVATSGNARKWATVLQGSELNPSQFNADIDKMARRMESRPKKALGGTAAPKDMDKPMSREAALREIRAGLGFVPRFLDALPSDALAGAWNLYRGLYQSETAEIPLKEKSLISLAVASQSSCNNCVKMDRRFSKAGGASNAELKEAIAMAGVTSLWSTVLNGMQTDEAQFRSEVQQIMQHMRQTAPGVQQLGGEVPTDESAPDSQ